MPLAKELTQSEKDQIYLLKRVNPDWSHQKIAEAVGRSRQTISRYLATPEGEKKGKRTGRPRVTSKTTDRQIVRTAIRGKLSIAETIATLNLQCSVTTTWRRLTSDTNTHFGKHQSKPPLTSSHKQARLKFATEMVSLSPSEWRNIIWSDEKKWNLDGPDGLHHYWYDLRTEKTIFPKRQQGGGGVMVWAGFSAGGSTEIAICKGRMDSAAYQGILSEYLIPVATAIAGDDYQFQQDNAPIHRSRSTMAWFEAEEVDVLTWPALSPDLNPIENLWGWMTRRVYANGRQFKTVSELRAAVLVCWSEVPEQLRKSLVDSMKVRMIEVIKKNGDSIEY